MPEYNVHHIGYVSHIETVVADSPEEAIDAAEEGNVSLCHQYEREWSSAGDTEVFSVADADGETVWGAAPEQPTIDREALARAAHHYFCVRRSEPNHDPRQSDYDKADEILEILALIGSTTP